MSKHGEFLQAMLKYAEARGLQVARIGTAFRGKLPDYCIVDDDLQPVREREAYLDSQPIRRTEPAHLPSHVAATTPMVARTSRTCVQASAMVSSTNKSSPNLP